MPAFVIRASKPGSKPREVTADTREQALVIAETWWKFLWENITINDIPWTPPPA
jgi:hypothetical protein